MSLYLNSGDSDPSILLSNVMTDQGDFIDEVKILDLIKELFEYTVKGRNCKTVVCKNCKHSFVASGKQKLLSHVSGIAYKDQKVAGCTCKDPVFLAIKDKVSAFVQLSNNDRKKLKRMRDDSAVSVEDCVKSAEASYKIAQFLADNNLSASVVDSASFRDMVAAIRSAPSTYELPCGEYFCGDPASLPNSINDVINASLEQARKDIIG